MDFLAYFSLLADALITLANIIAEGLPPKSNFNFYIINGTVTINTTAINQAGQQLLLLIFPLIAIAFLAHFLTNHWGRITKLLGVKDVAG